MKTKVGSAMHFIHILKHTSIIICNQVHRSISKTFLLLMLTTIVFAILKQTYLFKYKCTTEYALKFLWGHENPLILACLHTVVQLGTS